MFNLETLIILQQATEHLGKGFKSLDDFNEEIDIEAMEHVLMMVAQRMQNNYPYQHPFYIGQMLKPPHIIARLAYSLAMCINPNNHALDGGRESSKMEKEVVAAIARMFCWKEHLGHLSGGGTMANMEALWVSGKIHPDKKILASEQAHYTHQRISAVLQLDFATVACDHRGKMCLKDLQHKLSKGNVGTVVVTLGSTGLGALDPLPEILQLQKHYNFRIHVDTAYGGYFTLANNLQAEGRLIFDSLKAVDSIVIDPHKHGLQPYGCGCILFKDPAIGLLYRHDSPYTYFSSDELHLGEISLECSRAGASAVALWATQKLLPMEKNGEFALGLSKGRQAALEFYNRLNKSARFRTILQPELDIVVWAGNATNAAAISKESQRIFDSGAEVDLHMALIKLPKSLLQHFWKDVEFDEEVVTCLRACFMKPEHLEWMDKIYSKLEAISL